MSMIKMNRVLFELYRLVLKNGYKVVGQANIEDGGVMLFLQAPYPYMVLQPTSIVGVDKTIKLYPKSSLIPNECSDW